MHSAAAPEPQAFGRAAGQKHALPEHCCPRGQTVPHPPQLFASRVVSAQYDGLAVGQAVWAAEQVCTQLPAEQSWPSPQAVPFVAEEQVPEAPQCARSVNESMQWPPQFTRPAAQVTAHAPFEQTLPASQTVPHVPQFWLSLFNSTHEPLQLWAVPRQSGFVFEHPEANSAAVSSVIEKRLIVTPTQSSSGRQRTTRTDNGSYLVQR